MEYDVERYAYMQATIEEIETVLGVAMDDALMDAYNRGRTRGLLDLRKKQWERGLAGDPVTLTHLAKHYLNQHDKPSSISVSLSDAINYIKSLNDSSTLIDATPSPGKNRPGGVEGPCLPPPPPIKNQN